MKIIYVAQKETLPGSHGGAVHVLEVSRQLARRGHFLTAVVKQNPGQAAYETLDGFEIIRLPVRSNYLLFQSEPAVRELIKQTRPVVVMERYYNFAGAGVMAARACNIPSLLEVNAPMLDPAGTRKDRADQMMLGWMTRRALAQANAAARIVTPLAATVPPSVSRAKIREIPWGANVDLFDRARLDSSRLETLRGQINPQGRTVVAFLGSFRPWHGVQEFVETARQISQTHDDILFLMIGAGDLLEETRAFVEREKLAASIFLTGAVPYEQVPYYLALADVGVAPFNTRGHPPLQVGFYWSPLKVHEYMAMSLPVVTLDLAGLKEIARDGQEALLYREGDAEALRECILRLVDDPALARQLGTAGRARVVEHFSWQHHAELLEAVLEECVASRPHP